MGKVEILADTINPLEIEYLRANSQTTGNLSAAMEYGTHHKEDALEIEYFHHDYDEDFHISSQREILSILQGIANQGTRICMYYGKGQHFLMTTLLCADEHGMWLDVGSLHPKIKRLLFSGKITFVCVYQHVKIQFVTRDIVSSMLKNNEVYYFKLPDYLLRIQRREFFRSAVPSPDLVKCIIPIQPENMDDSVIMRAAPIVDISSGGIRLLCEGNEATLLPNKIFPDCQISLPDVGTMTITIEVRNSIDFTTPNKVVHKRVGCRFIGLDKQINIPLQRHITRLQSENMASRRLAAL